MDVALPLALALGFVSGFKHAFEPDHVIALSTLFQNTNSFKRAVKTGLSWGAGHTTMLVLGVLVVGVLRIEVLEEQLTFFEIPVAILLLCLGSWALYSVFKQFHELQDHEHDGISHFHIGSHKHPHSFGLNRTGWQGYIVGLIHGLAGSGALLLLVASTLPSLSISILYALIFGVGSILGMGLVSYALAIPFRASQKRPFIHNSLVGLSGILSIVLGLIILYPLFV